MRRIGLLLLLAGTGLAAAEVMSIAGAWNVRLESGASGPIFLPGTTDEGGYGQRTAGPEKGWLSRPFVYTGKAWYHRDIVIPEAWRGRRVRLFLERAHWSTEAMLDGVALGTRNSLTTPHAYDLPTGIAPGRHKLTICVDNSYLVPVGRDAHSVTEHTQTNWNGIIGRVELQATGSKWVDAVKVDARLGKVQLQATAHGGDGEMEVLVDGRSYAKAAARADQPTRFEFAYDGAPWDEWNGVLHRLTVRFGGEATDVDFGVREIARRGTQFTLNGRPILLRGTLECSIFPITAHPPTTVDEWSKLFAKAREYGLNHFRFHSWCPPEAAFVAADRAGFLLHVELPVWSGEAGKNEALDAFMRAEGHRMLETYGNHPSFTMLCLGNELRGDFAFMDALVKEFQQADPRRLYTFSADYVRKQPGPVSDYFVAQSTPKEWLRVHGARFHDKPSGTDADYSASVATSAVPIVAHELGQWVTYPDYAEIAKYTGTLKARNLEAFRAKLEERGLGNLSHDFQQASGRFAWRIYKEDIESVFRTPGIGGFQLLQLQDFPGQGEALIGLLDSFWDSKGILTPAEFRRFVNDRVVLLRMPKFVWSSDETFTARAEVANYSHGAMEGAARWRVIGENGSVVAQGTLATTSVANGRVGPLGDLRIPLAQLATRASRLRVEVEFAGVANDWDIWVYPPLRTDVPAGVLLTSDVAAAKAALDRGGRVLLLAPPSPKMQPMRFLPVFWSLSWFPKQEGTMGIFCDPHHPALRGFPTDGHSDFQWWELTQGARAFNLNGTSLNPVIRVIDDYHRNDNLAAVVEARVGKGKLLAVSLDLSTDLEHRPVARQLLRSLLDYAAGTSFEPQAEAALDALAGR